MAKGVLQKKGWCARGTILFCSLKVQQKSDEVSADTPASLSYSSDIFFRNKAQINSMFLLVWWVLFFILFKKYGADFN